MKERILVIRLGALGDLFLCAQAFASIRARHPDAEIALLTMPAFTELGWEMPWFDKVIVDPRPKACDLLGWGKLIKAVRAFAPDRVYDLQGKFRQTILYWALGGWRKEKTLAWSGAAPGCSHPRLWPPEPGMHYTDFVAAQLERAGVPLVEPDFSWLDGSLAHLDLPDRFVLFIPGCAPSRPYKRWPPLHYATLAKTLMARSFGVLMIGTEQDRASLSAIKAITPGVIDLAGRTSLGQLAALARQAHFVIGNDTGPTHLTAAVGAPTLALMSDRVDPPWSAPRGPNARWVQGRPLSALSCQAVEEALEGL